MTPTKTRRATRAGSSGSSPQRFSNLNMTLAFKNTTHTARCSQSPAKEGLLDSTASGHIQGSPRADEEENAKEDEHADDDLPGHVIAPPAHQQRNQTISSLKLNTSGFDGLAGLDDNQVPTSKSECNAGQIDSPRRPSTSDLTESDVDMSDMEFDIADDDDDYGDVDQVDLSDDEKNMEASEAAHLASKVNDWSEQDVGTQGTKGGTAINWDDHRTYDYEFPYPYSDPFSTNVEPDLSFEASTIADHSQDARPQMNVAFNTTPMDCDPHIGPNLFHTDPENRSSRSSSTTNTSDVGESPQVSLSGASGPHDDDTESEDLQEEIERRAQMLLARKNRKTSRKKRRRSSNQDAKSPPSASKIKKFSSSAKRIQALPKMTARGRVVCLSIPQNTKVRWLVGRVPIDPMQYANSPELIRSLRSRMFQQAYCPDPRELDVLRQLIMPLAPDNTYRQYGKRPLRLLDSPSPPARITTGEIQIPELSQSGGTSFDFTGMTDADGLAGLTVFQSDLDNFLNIDDEDEDDAASTLGLQSRRVSEVDGGMADGVDFENSESYDDAMGSDTDVDSPCPKRRRTIGSVDELRPFESTNQITA